MCWGIKSASDGDRLKRLSIQGGSLSGKGMPVWKRTKRCLHTQNELQLHKVKLTTWTVLVRYGNGFAHNVFYAVAVEAIAQDRTQLKDDYGLNNNFWQLKKKHFYSFTRFAMYARYKLFRLVVASKETCQFQWYLKLTFQYTVETVLNYFANFLPTLLIFYNRFPTIDALPRPDLDIVVDLIWALIPPSILITLSFRLDACENKRSIFYYI